MNRFAALTFALFTSSAMAGHHDETVITTASELHDWCKEESEASTAAHQRHFCDFAVRKLPLATVPLESIDH